MQQRHTPPEQQPEGDDQDLLTPDLPKEMKPIQTKPRQVGVHPRLTAGMKRPGPARSTPFVSARRGGLSTHWTLPMAHRTGHFGHSPWHSVPGATKKTSRRTRGANACTTASPASVERPIRAVFFAFHLRGTPFRPARQSLR